MEFLPDVEETGLIVTLGRWVIDDVCRQIAEWQQSYDGTVNVSVNISHREFSDPGLLPHILDCLRRHELSPANLTLEITEGVISAQAGGGARGHRATARGRDRRADRRLRHRHVVVGGVASLPDPGAEDRPLRSSATSPSIRVRRSSSR